MTSRLPDEAEKRGDGERVESADTEISDDEATQSALEQITPLVPAQHLERVSEILAQTVSEVSHHSGPLPRPSDLARYDEIQPGLAERIVRMAESEQEYRHSITIKALDRDFNLKSRGQNYALIGLVVLVLLCGVIAYLGDTGSAALVAGGVIVSVVGIFATGKFIDKQSSEEEDR